jgi:ABC-type transport system involved in multi-copper enzyme maturation permease subunit
MFGAILRFEVRYHLTRPITWFYFIIFLALGFFFMGSDAVQIGGGIGQVKRNAPWVVAQSMVILVAVGQVILTGLVGTAVLRDYQYQTHELLFTTPITRFAYLGGRFTGAFLVMVIVHLGIPAGLLLGPLMPWVDHAKMLPPNLGMHLSQFATLVLPTVFLLSAIFFAVGALTRSLFAIYTQGIFLLVAWSVTSRMLGNLSDQRIAGLADPFGIQAFSLLTRYWTVAEKNTLAVPLAGVMLENRLIWLAVAAVVVIVTFVAFRFRSGPITLGRTKTDLPGTEHLTPATAVAAIRRFDGAAWRQQVVSTTSLSFWSIVRQVPFLAIVAVGIVNMIMSASFVDTLYGEKTWPVTYTMAEVLEGGFLLFFIILITIYAGEAVWRERQLKLDQITDSLPTRTSVSLLGKLSGLVLVEALLLLIMIVAGVIMQTIKGYTHYELGLYFRYLFGTTLPSLIQITVLAFLVHVLVNQKYAGHVIMILFWIGRMAMSSLGVEHQLFGYANTPSFKYSDMNGFGPYLPQLTLSALYWTGVAVLLGVLALLFWVRGTETKWRLRLIAAGLRWSRPAAAVTMAAAVLAFGAGGAIFYNTNILNHYRNSKARRADQARYERTYKKFEKMAQPRLVAADVRADLEPEHLAFWASGTFTFVNKQFRPLDSVLVTIAHVELRIDTLAWNRPATALVSDSALGTRIYRFITPLAPGDTIRLRYRARYAPRGFANGGPPTLIADNGSFVNSEYFPLLGYQDGGEIGDDDDRQKEKLPPKARMPSIDDESARANSYLTNYADWIGFKATVSTAPDQIAIAPGYLVKDYQENGRRVFEYAMDKPMANFYAFLSARYAVKRDEHNGVKLEIYYHPGHEYNLDRMMASMKASLDYFGKSFSPYQFRQVRILEFPRYAGFAQAFPNTVPYSESIGFILRTGDGDDDLDLPFYVTAHEVGHQWWGHQVVGANMQGATWFSEGLANYSALTLMEKKSGRDNLQKFLANELDKYLLGRTTERKKELPLLLVENQGYIHYNKGSLALYAFRDLIGEAAMNRALAAFVAAKAFNGPPYPTSREFVRYLEAETPDSVKYAIDDLFKTITLWDNKTEDASVTAEPGGKYRVTIRTASKKFRADSLGDQREIPMADLVDIGVFGEREPGNKLGKPLYLAKVWVRGDTTFTIVVDKEPKKAGIDPYNKLIDRDPKDNVKDVRRNGP